MNNNNLSLHQLLKGQGLTPQVLFSQKNIASELKNNIQTFVNYSLRHKNFIQQCLTITLNSSYAQLQQNDSQNIAFCISEVLCCDEPVMADLFFQPCKEILRKDSQISQKIQQEQTENIQSQAQRLFQSDDPQDNLSELVNGPIQVSKDELAKKSLQVLENKDLNQSCLGYLYKIWSFLIRNNSNQVLQFFQSNRNYYQLIANNLQYYAISNLLAQLIVSEDKTKQYKYQSFKKQIFHSVIDMLIVQKENQLLFQGISVFLEEVLNNSKQSYYEYFQDFKRFVNYLSCQKILDNFFDIIMERKQITFKNALKYVQLIFERINAQKQGFDSSQKDSNEMVFEIDKFVNHFFQLATLLSQINDFSTITKIHYLTLLLEILKTEKFQKNKQKQYCFKIFIKLMDVFRNQSSKGLYKIKLIKLIEETIKLCGKQEITSFIQSQPLFYQSFFPTLKTLNFDNPKTYNKSQMIAFDCKILFQINNQVQNSVQTASKTHNKNLKRIQKKYQTKIANFGKPNKSFSLEEQGFFNFNEGFQNLRQNSNQNDGNESNLVGKNNVSIPVLHLPQSLKLNKQSSQRKNIIPPLQIRSNQSETTNQKNINNEQNNRKNETQVEPNTKIQPLLLSLDQLTIRKVESSELLVNQQSQTKTIEKKQREKIKYYSKHAILLF